MHIDAKQIVSLLLEDLAVACSACEKEFGVPGKVGDSHGFCKRHLIAQYQPMLAATPTGPQRASLQQKITAIQAMPDTNFPPDLAQQQQQQAA